MQLFNLWQSKSGEQFFFLNKKFIFLLLFNLPTYSITPSAHPTKFPSQCPSPSHPNPLPTSLSTTPCSFPRVRCLSCFITLTDIFTHFLSFPLYSLSLFFIFLFYFFSFFFFFFLFFHFSSFFSFFSLFFIFPKWMRPYNVCPSPIDLFHSAQYPSVPSTSKQMVGICPFSWLGNIPLYT